MSFQSYLTFSLSFLSRRSLSLQECMDLAQSFSILAIYQRVLSIIFHLFSQFCIQIMGQIKYASFTIETPLKKPPLLNQAVNSSGEPVLVLIGSRSQKDWLMVQALLTLQSHYNLILRLLDVVILEETVLLVYQRWGVSIQNYLRSGKVMCSQLIQSLRSMLTCLRSSNLLIRGLGQGNIRVNPQTLKVKIHGLGSTRILNINSSFHNLFKEKDAELHYLFQALKISPQDQFQDSHNKLAALYYPPQAFKGDWNSQTWDIWGVGIQLLHHFLKANQCSELSSGRLKPLNVGSGQINSFDLPMMYRVMKERKILQNLRPFQGQKQLLQFMKTCLSEAKHQRECVYLKQMVSKIQFSPQIHFLLEVDLQGQLFTNKTYLHSFLFDRAWLILKLIGVKDHEYSLLPVQIQEDFIQLKRLWEIECLI